MSTEPTTLESIMSDLGALESAFGRSNPAAEAAFALRRATYQAMLAVIFQKTPEGVAWFEEADLDTFFKNPEVLLFGPEEEFEEVDTDALVGLDRYPTFTGEYIARDWNGHTDVEVLRMARQKDKAVLLYGPPGTGKTQMAMAAFGEELITVLGSGDTEVSDLIGSYTQDKDGKFVWVDGPLLVAAMEGRPLLVDEIGLIDTKVLSIMYSFMDGRRQYFVTANPERGMVEAVDGFFIVAATNPNAPGVRLSEALLSRFPIQAEVTTDFEIARTLGVHPTMIRAAQQLVIRAQGGAGWSPQMRDLLAFRDLSATFGVEFAAASMIAGVPQSQRADVAQTLRTVLGMDLPEGKI